MCKGRLGGVVSDAIKAGTGGWTVTVREGVPAPFLSLRLTAEKTALDPKVVGVCVFCRHRWCVSLGGKWDFSGSGGVLLRQEDRSLNRGTRLSCFLFAVILVAV